MSSAICGKLPSEIEAYLKERGFKLFYIDPNLKIDPAVSFHADMAALSLGEKKVLLSKSQLRLKEELLKESYEVIMSDKEPFGSYPDDISLNIALFGNIAVGNFKFTDKMLLEEIKDYNLFNVKQGYTKCSILPVNEKAIITDDESIYNSLKNTLSVLLISKGDILLEGHEYGFIGGASAKISENEILFFGNVKAHCDYEKIKDFLGKEGVKIIAFNELPLTDFGGMVLLDF